MQKHKKRQDLRIKMTQLDPSPDTEWLENLLRDVQLEQFLTKIRDDLQVTRLAHFDYVHSGDLEKIGLGKPAIRRLLEAVRKKHRQQWRKNILSKQFLSGAMPTVFHATTDYSEQNRLKMNVNDAIAIIDDRPELQFIKGQNLVTYEIGTFPRYCVEQPQFQHKRGGISRPLQESFRHTGHGSSFGKCWGNPSALDNEFHGNKTMGDGVQLRSKTLGTIQTDRKGKCVSEQYVKERRLTAHKQFAYNKLKNDRAMAQTMSKNESKQKPERPPMPNICKKSEEGVLIYLSPEESSALKNLNQSTSNKTNICLLDEPIDVPTQGTTSRDFIAESDAAWEVAETSRRPPPYQFPPTYSNTLNLNQAGNNTNSPKFNTSRLQHSRTLEEHDPFNTSHISSNGLNLNHIYGNSGYNPSLAKQMSLGNVPGNEIYENREMFQQQSMGQVPRNNYGMIQMKQSTSAEFDQIAQRTSPSRPNYQITSDLTTQSITSLTSVDSGVVSQSTFNDDSLSESLAVNFNNAVSLDESNTSTAAQQGTPKKLDKTFLAELEKDIYKNQASANVNDFQAYGQKETTVNQISAVLQTKNYESTKNMNLNNYSPQKMQNNMSSDKNFMQTRNNYEAFVSKGNQGKSSYESTINFSKQSNNANNDVWSPIISPNNSNNINSNNIYGNSSVMTGSMSQLTEQNLQTISTISSHLTHYQYNTTGVGGIGGNLYSSVAGDLYGSVAGDIYEQVAETPVNIYSNYGAIPRPKGNINQTNSFSAIDLSNTSRELSGALYDEVANDTVDGLRPIRAAPLPPPGQATLSHQQIQRRLEKMTIQKQQVQALMQELGEEASNEEAKLALEAVNWDHTAAVRHFKVERLFRLGVASRERCQEALLKTGWSVELAASILLEA
uniref:non-specific protein-tyrosine kinase n=1 Tax=Culicoides sonorensis TaxID=179676 RepID=A0A336MGY0_CULSO